MLQKILVLSLILGICLASPDEDSKLPVPIPIGVTPPNTRDLPHKPPAPADTMDLKTDPSTWWYHNWYNTEPSYYYFYHAPRPSYYSWYPYYK